MAPSTTVSRLPVLIDTSVWIELLRDSAHPARPLLERLVADGEARLCGAVMAELLQGATTPKDLEAAQGLAKAIPMLRSTEDTWLEAGRLGQRLRSKGISVGLLDCFLAALAFESESALLSLDKHFPLIAKHTHLKLVAWPS
jgi:predicted nucleic acid-binding protein